MFNNIEMVCNKSEDKCIISSKSIIYRDIIETIEISQIDKAIVKKDKHYRITRRGGNYTTKSIVIKMDNNTDIKYPGKDFFWTSELFKVKEFNNYLSSDKDNFVYKSKTIIPLSIIVPIAVSVVLLCCAFL